MSDNEIKSDSEVKTSLKEFFSSVLYENLEASNTISHSPFQHIICGGKTGIILGLYH